MQLLNIGAMQRPAKQRYFKTIVLRWIVAAGYMHPAIGFEVLEKLHEKDVLSTINGLLGAKDTVINHVAGLVSSKEMINILRLSLLAGNLVKDIDPDALHGVLKEAQGTPPSFFQIGKRMLSPDARRAMGVFGGILNVFGAALKKKDEA